MQNFLRPKIECASADIDVNCWSIAFYVDFYRGVVWVGADREILRSSRGAERFCVGSVAWKCTVRSDYLSGSRIDRIGGSCGPIGVGWVCCEVRIDMSKNMFFKFLSRRGELFTWYYLARFKELVLL